MSLYRFCQTATGINFGLQDHRNKTEVLGKVLVSGKENPDSLECQVFCRFGGHSYYHVDLQHRHQLLKKPHNVCDDYLAPLPFLCRF